MRETDRDFLAVQEDALLVDIVAAREDVSAFADDHVAQLLAAYTADIDLGLELLANAELPAAPGPTAASISAKSTRRSARFVVAATTAVVLVGTSGVAAAVTGDPLSPFRHVVKVVTGIGAAPPADADRKDGPEQAATEADIAQTLAQVNQALRDGDTAEAQRLLDEIRADVGTEVLPPGLDDRINDMQDEVDHATGSTGNEPKGGGTGNQPDDPGQQGDGHANTSHPNKPGQGGEHPDKPGKTNNQGKNDKGDQSDTGKPGDKGTPVDKGNGGDGGSGSGEKKDNGKPADSDTGEDNGGKPDTPGKPPSSGGGQSGRSDKPNHGRDPNSGSADNGGYKDTRSHEPGSGKPPE